MGDENHPAVLINVIMHISNVQLGLFNNQ
jgi:hypothetical protein